MDSCIDGKSLVRAEIESLALWTPSTILEANDRGAPSAVDLGLVQGAAVPGGRLLTSGSSGWLVLFLFLPGLLLNPAFSVHSGLGNSPDCPFLEVSKLSL